MILFSSYSSPKPLTLDQIEKFTNKAKTDVIADNDKNSPIISKINKIWHAIEYWFSGSDALYSARNALYTLCELEQKYQSDASANISCEDLNVIIAGLCVLKKLMPEGHKNSLNLSLDIHDNISIKIDTESITLPNKSKKKIDSTKLTIINDMIDKNEIKIIEETYILNLFAEQISLSSQCENKLQEIHDSFPKNEGTPQCRETVVEQISLDNQRDAHARQYVCINGEIFKSLENYKIKSQMESDHKKSKEYIKDSEIFKLITEIRGATDIQINAICEYLCQTKYATFIGFPFNTCELYDKKTNNGENISFMFNQSRRVEYKTSQPDDSENTQSPLDYSTITITSTLENDILVSVNSFIIPKVFSLDNDSYNYPFKIALNFSVSIDQKGNEKIQQYTYSFIPTTKEFLEKTTQLKSILLKFNEEDEKKLISEKIEKNIIGL